MAVSLKGCLSIGPGTVVFPWVLQQPLIPLFATLACRITIMTCLVAVSSVVIGGCGGSSKVQCTMSFAISSRTIKYVVGCLWLFKWLCRWERQIAVAAVDDGLVAVCRQAWVGTVEGRGSVVAVVTAAVVAVLMST